MRLSEQLSHTSANFLVEESGASLTEYALIVSLVLVVCLLCVLALSKET